MVVGGLRCISCSTHDTPLWRAGPTGAKTLCNACGVKWKKGKLSLVIDGVSYSYGDAAPGTRRCRTVPRNVERVQLPSAATPKRLSNEWEQGLSEAHVDDADASPTSRAISVGQSRQLGGLGSGLRSRTAAGAGNRRGGATGRERQASRSRSQMRVSAGAPSMALPRSASWAQFGDCGWALSGVSKPGRSRRRKGTASVGSSARFGQLQRSASAVSLAPLPEFGWLPSRSGSPRQANGFGVTLFSEWSSYAAEMNHAHGDARSVSGNSLESGADNDVSVSNRSTIREENQSVAEEALLFSPDDPWSIERGPMIASWPLASTDDTEMGHQQSGDDGDGEDARSIADPRATVAEYIGWHTLSGLDSAFARDDPGMTNDTESSAFSESHRTSHREDGLMSAAEEAFMVAAVHGFCVQENDHSLGTNASNLMQRIGNPSGSIRNATMKKNASLIATERPPKSWTKSLLPPSDGVPPNPVMPRTSSGYYGSARKTFGPNQSGWALQVTQETQDLSESSSSRYPHVYGNTVLERESWNADGRAHGNGGVESSRGGHVMPAARKLEPYVGEFEENSSRAGADSPSRRAGESPIERPVLTDLLELAPTSREVQTATQLLAAIPPLPTSRDMTKTSSIMALVRDAQHPFSKLYAVGVYRLASLMARFPPDSCNTLSEEAYIRAFVADQASCSICSAQTAAATHGRLDMQRAHSLALQGFYYDPHAYRRAVAAFRNMYAVSELNSFAIDEFFRVFMYDTRVALAKQRTLCQSSPAHSCHRHSSTTGPMHQDLNAVANNSESSSSSALRSKA
ncbi:blue light receptor [Cyanidiococcus yangmingshanensis]|uniref:Blue light receptor n=1 Tax=Cyanidiococcus yangmingshanensis TaxID=2690220 RepID=A0A7J7IMC0_9RHOD|nr:blue light receptor [Cyanidiococcus yangmingshanensis]